MILPTAFNLINGIDIAETESRIEAYRRENAALIELNIQRDERDIASLLEEEARERKERELRAAEERLEEEAEKMEKEREKLDIIDKLVSRPKRFSMEVNSQRLTCGQLLNFPLSHDWSYLSIVRQRCIQQSGAGSAKDLIAKSRKNAEKRHAQKATTSATTLSLKEAAASRIRAPAVEAQDVPHVPLEDDWLTCSDKFTVRSSYVDPTSQFAVDDADGRMRAGGYMLGEIWERAIRSAIMGLDLPPPGRDGDVVMT